MLKYYTIRPIYLLSVAFGTLPCFSYNQGNEKYSISKTRRAYIMTLIWLFISAVSHIYYNIIAQNYSYTGDYNNKANATKMTKYDLIVTKLTIAENWAFNIASLINFTIVLFTSKRIPSILESLQQVEHWLHRIGGNVIVKQAKIKELKKSSYWLISSYFVILITMMLEYSGILTQQRNSNLLNMLLQDFGKLSMMTFDLQFCTLCILLHSRKCPRSTNLVTKAETEMKYPEISEINHYHRIMCKTTFEINKSYEIQLSSNMVVCFFNTVCVLFTTISEYRASVRWILWISGLLWVSYYILRMVMVCTSASSVTNQCNRSRMLLSCIDSRMLDEKNKNQVFGFMRRLANEKTEFALCGILALNTYLLSSAALGIITYLVIALQYNYT